MKRYYIDTALISLCGLLALAGVVGSASGVEKVTIILLTIIFSVAIFIVGLLLVGLRIYTRRAVIPAMIGPVVCLAITISIAASHWPLRVAYVLSRDTFDAVAQRVRAGEYVAMPLRSGLFSIRRVELSHNGIVCLWMHPHPGGSTGFVRCPRNNVPFNLWSIVQLDERWQFISED